jgi:hypothetical protein
MCSIYFANSVWASTHIYLIGALLVVVFSNKLTNELSPFEAAQEEARRRGDMLARFALMIVPPVALAVLVIFPVLELLTHADRSGL